MKYAIIEKTEGGWELRIGRDVPGEASHGLSVCKGMFSDRVEAVNYALASGVDISRITVSEERE